MAELFDLAGRVAIVTGAGSGIGRATAALLDSLGVAVIATDIDEAAVAATAAGFVGDGGALRHDVTGEADWDAVIAEAGRRGRLDILVNNAGVMMNRAFLDTPLADFRRDHAINVESVFIGMQKALPLLRDSVREAGTTASIVNLSSIYGQVAGARFAAYSATKGAVRMLSKAAANEFASFGVRVNSVHPGPTRTNLMAGWGPVTTADGQVIPLETALQAAAGAIPMKRFGEAGEIAATIAFLAGDGARYVTGAEIVVDGGYTAI